MYRTAGRFRRKEKKIEKEKERKIAGRRVHYTAVCESLLATQSWQRGDTIVNEWRVTRVGTLRSPLSPAAEYAAVQQALCARYATYAIVNASQPREHVPPHFNRPKALPARLFNAIPANRNNESYPLTIDAFVFIQNGIMWNRIKRIFVQFLRNIFNCINGPIWFWLILRKIQWRRVLCISKFWYILP